jgi:hypothetical protein
MYNSKVMDNSKKSSSSSAMADIESALQEIGSDDAFSSPMNSPTKELQKSILVTHLLDVTPVHVKQKKSIVRREPDIINKANKVRCAFIKLHSNFIPSECSVTTSSKVADDYLFVADDKKKMDEIRLKCLQLKKDNNASGIISLLTLAPSSWSQQTCADYFSISISQVPAYLKEKKECYRCLSKRLVVKYL